MAEIKSIQIGSTTYDLRDDTKVVKNTAITAGTKCKITYDAKGLVTGGANLEASDIPSLGAGKITSGTFDTARIPSLAASKITSGTFDIARIPTGSSSTTSSSYVVKCDDSRLSNSRPASDVYSWAKAATKPSYTLDEVTDGTTRKLSNYLPLTGGNVTGDLALYAASGDSPRLTFQRGTLSDTYNDWSLYDSSGYLYIQQRGSGSSSWETRAAFDQSGVNFVGSISEGGTTLANKYLGKSAKAADSDKLDGNDSTYFQKALPTTTTAGKVLKSTSTAGTVVWGDDSNTNTWRNIKVDGTEKLGTGTGTGALSFVSQNTNNGDITFTYDNGIKAKAKFPTLAAVATSGSYNDLSNKPTIPTDTNQKIKAGSVTFGNNDVVDIVAGDNVTITGLASGTGAPKITISSTYTDTGATGVTITGSGNVFSSASYDASTRKITFTKGVTALTSHQSIKSLDTTATAAQSTSSSEAIAGSGTIKLHKVSKTGSYSDLIGTPTIPATNVIPATTIANKMLVSTITSGTAKWSDWSSAGFLKTDASGVISVDTNSYVSKDTNSIYGSGGVDVSINTSHQNRVDISLDSNYIKGMLSTSNKLITASELPPTITISTGSTKSVSDGTNTLTFGSNAFNSTTIPTTYLKSASVSGNTLTLTKQDNTTVTFTPSGGGSLYLHNFVLSGYFDPGCGEYDFELHGHYISSSTAEKYTESETDLLKLMSEGEIDYGIWQDQTWSVVKWPASYSSKRGEITAWGFMWTGNDSSYDPPHYFMATYNSGDFGMYDYYTSY